VLTRNISEWGKWYNMRQAFLCFRDILAGGGISLCMKMFFVSPISKWGKPVFKGFFFFVSTSKSSEWGNLSFFNAIEKY
jgi:hypothetical protein